ncbi:MAG: hypothetical protein AB8C84_05655 [Oligoflexales bacterium]
MSTSVINLRHYRNKQRELWKKKNLARVGLFIQHFIEQHHPELQIISSYRAQWQYHASESAWDYQDFRDLLHTSLEELSRAELYPRLQTQWWFDTTLISNGEVLELFLANLLEAVPLNDRESL